MKGNDITGDNVSSQKLTFVLLVRLILLFVMTTSMMHIRYVGYWQMFEIAQILMVGIY